MEHVIQSVLIIIAFILGYNIGRGKDALPSEEIKKGTIRIVETIKKAIPPKIIESDIGPVNRPTQKENFIRDNPDWAEEQEVLTKEFDSLLKR